MVVFLTGFMGAGKTSVGRALAVACGIAFYDLDERIENRHQQSIHSLFKIGGESEFRALENEEITDLCAHLTLTRQSAIVALGGGTLRDNKTVRCVKKTGKILCLDVLLETAHNRLASDQTMRPIARGKSMKDLQSLYDFRQAQYHRVSDFIIAVAHKSIPQLVSEIRDQMTFMDSGEH